MYKVDSATLASRGFRKEQRAARAEKYAAEIAEIERTGTCVELDERGEFVAPPMPSLEEIAKQREAMEAEKVAAEKDAKSADAAAKEKATTDLEELEREKARLDCCERWQKGEPSLDDLEAEANAAIALANDKRAWLANR